MSKKSENSRELLLRVINLCKTVNEKTLDPFEVEVCEILETLRSLLDKYKSFEDYCLDAEAINDLSKVVKLQEEWLKHKSKPHLDIETVKSKIRSIETKRLAEIFLESWNPIVTIKILPTKKLEEALKYWKNLIPRKLEMKKLDLQTPAQVEVIPWGEVENQKLILKREFEKILNDLWQLLKSKVKNGKVSYWDFVYSNTYDEFIMKAYLTSFLISYGYADLSVDPLKNEIFLFPKNEPKKSGNVYSFIIPISYEKWIALKKVI
ncbi:MAG: hypothetical protein ACKD6N_02640 [Candidatus Bathyarchaeota archaeon]